MDAVAQGLDLGNKGIQFFNGHDGSRVLAIRGIIYENPQQLRTP